MSNIWTIARRHVVLTVVLVALVVSSGTLFAAAKTTSAAVAAPTISQEPADATDSGRAKFKLEHPRKDVTFECSLDGSPFTPCHKNVQYQDLAPGQHCFRAKAVTPAGVRSPEAERCWTNMAPATFGITASVTGLYPGRSVPLDLQLSNPHNQDIYVQSVTITVGGTTSAGCDGPANLTVSRDLQGPVRVPKRSTRTLSQLGIVDSRWPELTMPNLAENQDACKATQFALTYTGTATK